MNPVNKSNSQQAFNFAGTTMNSTVAATSLPIPIPSMVGAPDPADPGFGMEGVLYVMEEFSSFLASRQMKLPFGQFKGNLRATQAGSNSSDQRIHELIRGELSPIIIRVGPMRKNDLVSCAGYIHGQNMRGELRSYRWDTKEIEDILRTVMSRNEDDPKKAFSGLLCFTRMRDQGASPAASDHLQLEFRVIFQGGKSSCHPVRPDWKTLL